MTCDLPPLRWPSCIKSHMIDATMVHYNVIPCKVAFKHYIGIILWHNIVILEIYLSQAVNGSTPKVNDFLPPTLLKFRPHKIKCLFLRHLSVKNDVGMRLFIYFFLFHRASKHALIYQFTSQPAMRQYMNNDNNLYQNRTENVR